MLLTFDPFYIEPNINMAIQRVFNEMQEYKYVQFMQFNYLQVKNIIVKRYLYILIVILFSYTLILSLLKS